MDYGIYIRRALMRDSPILWDTDQSTGSALR